MLTAVVVVCVILFVTVFRLASRGYDESQRIERLRDRLADGEARRRNLGNETVAALEAVGLCLADLKDRLGKLEASIPPRVDLLPAAIAEIHGLIRDHDACLRDHALRLDAADHLIATAPDRSAPSGKPNSHLLFVNGSDPDSPTYRECPPE